MQDNKRNIMSMSIKLDVNPRDYQNDLRFLGETSNQSTDHQAIFMRGLQIALPFAALYQPTAYHFSLGMNLLRSSTCFSEFVSKQVNSDKFEVYALVETALAVGSAAGVYFQHPLAGVLTSGHDLIKELINLADYFNDAENTKPFVKPFLGVLNQALFLSLISGGGIYVQLALLGVNILQSAVMALEESNKGRNPEAYAHIIMGLFRVRQFVTLVNQLPNPMLDFTKELIKILDKYGAEAQARDVPVTYVIIEKGDLQAMQMLYWAHYKVPLGVLNHALANEQFEIAIFLLDQKAPISALDVSRFIKNTKGLEEDRQLEDKLGMVARLIEDNLIDLKSPLYPIYRDVLFLQPASPLHKLYRERAAKLLTDNGAELVGRF